MLLSLWFGLVTGLLELTFVILRKQFVNTAALGALQLNRHAVWMIPAADVMILGALGLILAVGGWLRLRGLRVLAAYGLSFVSALTLVLTFRGLTTIAYAAIAGGIAALLTRRQLAHAERFRRIVRVSLPGLAILFLGLVGWEVGRASVAERWALGKLPPPPAGAPNVLFVVLDTVRAESLSVYGYGRETSPFLARLAARGIRFDRARTSAAWTLPSHASMFTGRWPHELSARIDTPLDATHPTLAEYLRDRGYATAGFIANTYFCNHWYGLGRGFLHYEDTAVNPLEVLRSSGLGRRLVKGLGGVPRNRPGAYFQRKDAPTINAEVLAWLDHRGTDRPFLAFLNYYDAHDPYLTPVEPTRRFGLRPGSRADVAMLQNWHLGDKTGISPRDVQLARDCYDDCIAYLDAQLGTLLEGLERRGLLENTVVVITSDHGEEFGERERKRFGHGQSLHHEVTGVPLLIVAPGRIAPGRVVTTPVSLRDLPATIAGLAGLSEGSPFPGRSLARHWSAAAPAGSDGLPGGPGPDPVLAEIVDREPQSPRDWKPPRSVIVDELLYIREADGREELYDLAADPAETNNLAGSGGESVRADLERCRSALHRLDPDSARR
jgi:arylsulfatase A-like enzyme